MDKDSTIIITGAAGFIGSCLIEYLNEKGFENLILVDDFSNECKKYNLLHRRYLVRVEKDNMFEWLYKSDIDVSFVFHLGAITDTTYSDYVQLQKTNVEYSIYLWDYCVHKNIPLVYASSAATYGNGDNGYDDSHEIIDCLKPLNYYGKSKNDFDKWVLNQKDRPPFWAGLKFFNVYGNNEYHKGRMSSVVLKSFNEIKENGFVNLFKSHRSGIKNGEQLRDFVYVKDILKLCHYMMCNEMQSAIYNVGTGKARTFLDLVKATFSALNITPEIRYIDMPKDIMLKYQYFTEANMSKIREAGYKEEFYTLEEGVHDYVYNYLNLNK